MRLSTLTRILFGYMRLTVNGKTGTIKEDNKNVVRQEYFQGLLIK